MRKSARLEELLPSAQRPAPIVFQRRAAAWVDRLSETEEKAEVEGLKLGVISSLRGLLVTRCGLALRELDAVRTLAARANGAVSLELSADQAATRVAVQVVGSDSIVAAGPGARVSLKATATNVAWQAREWARRSRMRGQPDGLRPFVLMLPRMSVHLVDMLPVADELQRRGLPAWFSCAHLHAAMVARGLTVDHVGESLPAVARLAARMYRLGTSALSTVANEGDEGRVFQRVATLALREMVMELASYSRRTARLLRQRQPRVIMVGNPYALEGRCAALLARGAGIPSIALEHGLSFESDPYWGACAADWVGCWGDAGRRALKSSGVAEERLIITGAPRLDRFVGTAAPGARPRAVLVATSGGGDQVSHEDHLAFIEVLYTAAERVPDVEWVVKLHPKDREALYAASAAKHPAARVTLKRGDRTREGVEIYEYLRRTAMLVTVVSATALDAIALSVPVISVLVGGEHQYQHVEVLRRGAVSIVKTAEELSRTVTGILDGHESESARAAAEQFGAEQFAYRGAAAKRVADVLVSRVS